MLDESAMCASCFMYTCFNIQYPYFVMAQVSVATTAQSSSNGGGSQQARGDKLNE